MTRTVAKHELVAMISGAERDLSDAEAELDKVLGEIRVDPHGEKTGMTGAVEHAFAKLRRAKHMLADLEARVLSSTG
jgi:hypothetical protein